MTEQPIEVGAGAFMINAAYKVEISDDSESEADVQEQLSYLGHVKERSQYAYLKGRTNR